MKLFERTLHLDELGRLLREAAAGHGRLVLLAGEAGVGKTALVRWFSAKAPAKRQFSGACDPLAMPRPLGPLLDIAASAGAELRLLAGSGAPRHRVFSAFLAELDLEPAPTLAILEDVHWADEASLDLLRFLGRRLGSTHALVIATYRDDEIGPTHPLQLVLGDLATASAVHRIPLYPLSMSSVEALCIDSHLDPNTLYRQTGGNPFYVTEVLAMGAPGIPETVRDAVLARAARLSPAGRTVLDAAAVIGSPIDPWLLTRVADPAAGAVEECLAGGMLRADGQTLDFRHELARDAIQSAIAPPRRMVLHACVLAALRSNESPDYARLAHHAEEASDRKATLLYAPLAAERAAALHAHREAAAQYARALRFDDGLPPKRRGELLDAHAHECSLTDRVPEGIASGEEALAVWRQVGDRSREGDSLRRLSRLYWLAGRREDAERTGWDAVAVLEEAPTGAPLAMAYSNISQLFLLAWHTDKAIAWGGKAIALAEVLGETETLVHALHNVGMAHQSRGDPEGTPQVERSLRLALSADLEEHAARAYGNFGLSQVVDYHFAAADGILRAGIAYCAERDLDQQRLYMLAWLALSLFHQGRWAEAVETAAAVLDQPLASPPSRIMALVARGRVHVRRGDPEAGALLDEALGLAAQTGELQRLGPIRVARAEAAWLAGNPRRVIAEARDMLDHVLEHEHRWLVGELAFWLWRANALETAPPDAQEPFAMQIAGKWAAAAACWQALGCPYEAAWALADGDDEFGLRRAHDIFIGLEAFPAAAIVARRLRRQGARGITRGPRPATREHPARLTPRQAEILGLMAEGRRNAEIARQLFLSPRTVAHHVSAILAKLGVSTRADAVRAAGRLGIAGQNGHPPGAN